MPELVEDEALLDDEEVVDDEDVDVLSEVPPLDDEEVVSPPDPQPQSVIDEQASTQPAETTKRFMDPSSRAKEEVTKRS